MGINLYTKNGLLYVDDKLVGDSEVSPGFTQYIFDDEPLGQGANGITYGVKHKILNVRQVVKIYFPKDDETEISIKAKEESIKNANTTLTGIIAITFDAGEYHYPLRLWYSIMESVTSYATIKQWRAVREEHFPSITKKFDIEDSNCKSSIHTSLNLASGLLQAVIGLYENNVIHGDLNPGNILWILENGTLNEALAKFASYSYSVLGELEPYKIKLIDMGASKANDLPEAGIYRDSYKLYEHIKSLLAPLFCNSKSRFNEWLNFELFKVEELSVYGVEKLCGVKDDKEDIRYIKPDELAGDFFRLICVLTIALGMISNNSQKGKKSISLDNKDIQDFFILMNGDTIKDAIEALSFTTMITLQKICKLKSSGRLINWHCVWNTYPFTIINTEPLIAVVSE